MLTWSCNNCPYSTNVRSASNDDIYILLLRLLVALSCPSVFLHLCLPAQCLPVHQSSSLSVISFCLPFYWCSGPSVFQSLCRQVPLSFSPSVFLSLCLPASKFLSLCLPVPLSSSPSVSQSLYLLVLLSYCPSIFLLLCLLYLVQQHDVCLYLSTSCSDCLFLPACHFA
jgi:hypothetical protein